MSIIIPANSAVGSGGYQVANGVRFDDASSSNFSDGSAPGGNRQKFTWSAWFKRSSIGATQILASSSYSGSDQGYLYFNSGNGLGWQSNNSGDGDLNTAMLFRDTGAWYHVVFSVDTTQGTATNRIKLYINGSQYTWDGSNTTPPNLNQSLYFNVGGSYNSYIGRRAGGDYFDGYMSEIVFIDNAQLAADSFGEFDEDSGIWKPLESVEDLTFGTSGYYLNFQDSSALGTDVSGVGNTFTANNLAAIDQTTDTCTNNFATLMHPGYDDGGNVWQNLLSEGNLFGASTSGGYSNYIGTIGLSTGKWYWETKVTLSGATNANSGTGIKSAEYTQKSAWQSGSGSYYFSTTGDIGNATTPGTSYGSAISSGNIVGVAYDATNGVIWFSINGTWQNSATISEIEAGTTTNAAFSSIASGTYLPFGTDATASATFDYGFNFGSPFYAISSGNADGNGYGNFEYAVPSGYYALNTKNLAEYG